MIFRKAFAELTELMDEFPVIALVGARQCGKTTMAKMAAEKLDKPVIYLDLELSSDLAKLNEAELFLKEHEDKLVIIDEVQHKPDLFPLIRALVDQKPDNGRFLVLGSASPQLLKQTAESLTGRIFYIEMSPFMLEEVWNDVPMNQHWFLGGYPKSVLARSEAGSHRWVQAYVKNYIERDLPQLGLSVPAPVIEKFWRMLASYHSGIWNASKIATAMGLSSNTIARYLYYLEEAYLVNALPAYVPNSLKRLVKAPKVYVRDSGVYHYLSYIKSFEQLQGDVRLGASWEGYVVEQIYARTRGKLKAYYYRTHNGAECDLVLCEHDKPVYALEIKYSSHPHVSKGYFESIKDLNAAHHFVIVPTGESYPIQEHVRAMCLTDFLKILP